MNHLVGKYNKVDRIPQNHIVSLFLSYSLDFLFLQKTITL